MFLSRIQQLRHVSCKLLWRRESLALAGRFFDRCNATFGTRTQGLVSSPCKTAKQLRGPEAPRGDTYIVIIRTLNVDRFEFEYENEDRKMIISISSTYLSSWNTLPKIPCVIFFWLGSWTRFSAAQWIMFATSNEYIHFDRSQPPQEPRLSI